MNPELNERIARIIGECWHKWERTIDARFKCVKCGEGSCGGEHPQYDTDPIAFDRVLKWCEGLLLSFSMEYYHNGVEYVWLVGIAGIDIEHQDMKTAFLTALKAWDDAKGAE